MKQYWCTAFFHHNLCQVPVPLFSKSCFSARQSRGSWIWSETGGVYHNELVIISGPIIAKIMTTTMEITTVLIGTQRSVNAVMRTMAITISKTETTLLPRIIICLKKYRNSRHEQTNMSTYKYEFLNILTKNSLVNKQDKYNLSPPNDLITCYAI